MAAADTQNTKKLDEMLKPHTTSFDFLAEAFKEVAKEDGEKRKVAAKELIRKALGLKGQMDQAKKDFDSASKKFDKELGKIVNRLSNMAAGRPIDDNEEKEEDKEQKSE